MAQDVMHRSRRRVRPRRAARLSWRVQLARALKASGRNQEVTLVWHAILDRLEQTVPAGGALSDTSELSAAEAAALERGSSGLDVSSQTSALALARTTTAWADLLADSANVTDVARRLGVQESRVRQRLADRSLYGFKHDGIWHIPNVQFYEGRLLPGIGDVAPRLSPTLHPLAVASWFVTPTPDLALHGRAASPRDWLLGGGDPADVAALAADL